MMSRARVIAILFAALSSVSLATASRAAGEPAFVVEGHLTVQKLARVAQTGIVLPQLRVYDREGRLLRNFGPGYAPAAFTGELDGLVARPVAGDGVSPTLEHELDGVVDAAGEPMVVPGGSDLVFVEYWADWCQPCHAQLQALTAYLEAHRNLDATLLHIAMAPASAVKVAEPPR
jgi:thiol-disulfide isomerase/thioredoxin